MCFPSCAMFTIWTWELTVDLHALILCVSEGCVSELLCIHIVDIGTSDLHALILCVSEDFLSQLLCIHIVGMETFDLHGLILCDSEAPICTMSSIYNLEHHIQCSK